VKNGIVWSASESVMNVIGVATTSYVERAEDPAHEESESFLLVLINRIELKPAHVIHPGRLRSSRQNDSRQSLIYFATPTT
jgi:hypothetical protein